MSDCIFCQIAAGKIPSTKVYEDKDFFAFRDLVPTAPTHVLVIPKVHIAGITDIDSAEKEAAMSRLLTAVRKVAELEGIAESGFRTVINTGHDGGQTVGHLHAHVIGGKELGWPPFKD